LGNFDQAQDSQASPLLSFPFRGGALTEGGAGAVSGFSLSFDFTYPPLMPQKTHSAGGSASQEAGDAGEYEELQAPQEYLAHQKNSPSQDHHRSLGIGLL